ncbi:hypothetical protein P7C70_g2816, partial [Phenoliferia sp. Uapishka_3]
MWAPEVRFAQPLFNAASEQEAADLRIRVRLSFSGLELKVAQLEALVAFMSSRPSPPAQIPVSPSLPFFGPPPPPTFTLDMTTQDVSGILAQIARGETPSAIKSHGLALDAKALVDSQVASTHDRARGPLHNPFLSVKSVTTEELVRSFPDDSLALLAYQAYSEFSGCYSHPLGIPSFERDWEELRLAVHEYRLDDIDGAFMATFFAILATGLSSLSVERASSEGVLDRDVLVDSWLELAVRALSGCMASDLVTLEAVRAGVVLVTQLLYLHPIRHSGLGSAILAATILNAFTLELHRELEDNSTTTSAEAEDRRRVFWNLYYVSVFSSSLLGGPWAPLSLKQVDVQLPLADNSDAIEGSEDSRVAILLCKMQLAVVAQNINDRALGVRAVTFDTVLELDRELKAVESIFPSYYRLRFNTNWELVREEGIPSITEQRACTINIDIAFEFLRLHRPWMGVVGVDAAFKYSQLQAIKYSRILLSIYESPVCQRLRWNGLLHKAMSAAILLAVEVLNESRLGAYDGLRTPVQTLLSHLRERDLDSELLNSSASVLEFLVEKDATALRRNEGQRQPDVSAFLSLDLNLKSSGGSRGSPTLGGTAATSFTTSVWSQQIPWTPGLICSSGQSTGSYFPPTLGAIGSSGGSGETDTEGNSL